METTAKFQRDMFKILFYRAGTVVSFRLRRFPNTEFVNFLKLAAARVSNVGF
jgi:hypothetical protein